MLPYLIITAVCHPWIIACPQEVQLAPYSSVRSRSLRSYEPHGQDGWFGSYEGHRSFFYGRLHLRVLGWSRYRRMVEELSSGMRWDLSTSRRMLEPLMRAGPGRVLCALLVSCIAHVAHAHTERCADLPSTRAYRVGCSNRNVASCSGRHRVDLGINDIVLRLGHHTLILHRGVSIMHR